MQRPVSIMVFGVLNIVFGAFGLLGSLFAIPMRGLASSVLRDPRFHNDVLEQMERSPFLKTWTAVALGLGIVASVLLVVAGIGLLQTRAWARVVSVGYSVYAIAMSIAGFVVYWVFVISPLMSQMKGAQGPEAAGAIVGVAGGTAGSCMGVIYAALLWWFMTRPHVVAAFEPTWSTAAGPPSGFVPPRARPDQPSSPCVNPYAPPAAPIVDTPSGSTADEALATIIPYRNAPALIAYYLGLFSLAACIPLVGLVGVGMAVAAVILGVKGLRRAAEHPDAKGRVHAWIGILGGAVCGAVGLLINMLAIIALLASITGR